MDRFIKFLFGMFLFVFFSACSSSPEPTRTSPTKKPVTSVPQVRKTATSPSSSSGNRQSSGSSSAEFSIPSQSDKAPNGVLNQLLWAPVGGGDIGNPCGNCVAYIQGSKIVLRDFNPNQNLRLILYREIEALCDNVLRSKYLTTLYVQVDADGNLDIKLTGETKNIKLDYVYDADTGKLEARSIESKFEDDQEKMKQICEKSSCPGAPPQKIKVGDKIYVCTKNDSVALREGAGKNFSTLKRLVPGADLEVIGGPKCANNWSWWKVETESGFVGWMAEGGDNTDPYFICPR